MTALSVHKTVLPTLMIIQLITKNTPKANRKYCKIFNVYWLASTTAEKELPKCWKL